MKKENEENEENENLNDIIPKLIGKSQIFTKGMNEKLKSNMIFKEFDYKAKKDFYFYLDNSTKRYKGLKNGGQLDNFIKEAQILNEKKAKKILTDSFYTELNLDEDREGMKYNHNGPILTEINDSNNTKYKIRNNDRNKILKSENRYEPDDKNKKKIHLKYSSKDINKRVIIRNENYKLNINNEYGLKRGRSTRQKINRFPEIEIAS